MLWGPSNKRKSPVSITTSSTSSHESAGDTFTSRIAGSDSERESNHPRGIENNLHVMQKDPPETEAYSPMKRPTLEDILNDKALSPWTLKAFKSWCAKNMCAENLNFVVDARAYQRSYTEWRTEHPDDTPESSSDDRAFQLHGMWKRMIKEYLTPNGLQEVNLSANVRDKLASISEFSIPPSPDIMQPAVRQIRGLLEDSILMSFLNEMLPPGAELNQADSVQGGPSPRVAPSQKMPSSVPGGSGSGATSKSKRSQITPQPPSRKGFFHHGSTGHVTTSSEATNLDREDSLQSTSGMSAITTSRSDSPAGSSMANFVQRERRPSPWSRNDATWKKLSSKFGLKKKSSGQHLTSGEHAVEEDEEPHS